MKQPKLYAIAIALLLSLNSYALPNVDFWWDDCFKFSNNIGWHINLNFNTQGCNNLSNDAFIFWVRDNNNVIYGPIAPASIHYNPDFVTLSITNPTLITKLEKGECFDLTYDWWCDTGNGFPPSWGIDNYFWWEEIVKFNVCPCPEDQVSTKVCDFSYCFDSFNPNNSYNYEFDDVNLSFLSSSIGQSFLNFQNSAACVDPVTNVGYNKVVLVIDEWSDNNGTFNSSTDVLFSINNSTTFSKNPIYHTFNPSSVPSSETVCHKKSIVLGCLIGYFPNGKPKYTIENTLYECETCIDICFNKSTIVSIYTGDDNHIPTLAREIDPQILQKDSCVANFNICSETSGNNGYYPFHFSAMDYNYLIENAFNNLNCNTWNGAYPKSIILTDNWIINGGTPVQIITPIDGLPSSVPSGGLPSLITSYTHWFQENTYNEVCHSRTIEIACLIGYYPDGKPKYMNLTKVFECNVCLDICVPEPHYNITNSKISKEVQYSLKESLDVYPNPATSALNVRGLSGNATINIMDVLGRTVKSVSFENINTEIKLNVSDLTKGNYILKVTQEGKVMTKTVSITE